MSERYFYLRELREDQVKGQGAFPTAWIVPESKLKRKLTLMVRWLMDDINFEFTELGWHNALQFVFHGSTPCYICGKTDGHEPTREPVGERGEVSQTEGYMNAIKGEAERIRTQPSPAPTREEWDQWIDEMPDDMLTGDWFLKIRQWFRTMPIVPRGK